LKRRIHILIGLVLSAVLVWLTFRHTDWGEVYASMRDAKLGWLLLSQVPLWASFFARIQRWKYVVRAVEPGVSFRHMLSATQIGLFGNIVLPARLGEVIRPFVLGRLAHISFSKCFALNVLDRVADLIGLMAVMIVALVAFRPESAIVLPPSVWPKPIDAGIVRGGAASASLFLLAVVVALVLLYVKKDLILKLSDGCVGLVSKGLAERAHHMLEQFAEGLHVFRSASDMGKCVFFSLVTWACFLVSFGCVFNAFAIDWPWYAPFVAQALLAVLISVPGAPGFVGQFHLAIVAALVAVVPGIELARVQAVAIVSHLANAVVPVVMAGVFCLFWEKMSFLELTRESTHVAEEVEADGEDALDAL